MKKRLTVLLVLLAACHSGGAPSPAMTGAASPETAVTSFLAAAKAQDLQALGAAWGTARGPARNYPPPDMEKAELIMIRLLCQDRARPTDNSLAPEGKRIVTMELGRAGATVAIKFTTVKGPANRWYVETFELEKLQPFCH